MDLNTTTFVALPEPRFAPELLLPALLAANISVALVADYFSETAFELRSSRVAVISALALDAYSRCAEAYLNLQLACYHCDEAQRGFISGIVAAQNATRARLARYLFVHFNGSVSEDEIRRELLLVNAENVGQSFFRELCLKFRRAHGVYGVDEVHGEHKEHRVLDCDAFFEVPAAQIPQGPRLEDLIAQVVRLGLVPIVEHRGDGRCDGLYHYLGLRYFSCSHGGACVRGSGGGSGGYGGVNGSGGEGGGNGGGNDDNSSCSSDTDSSSNGPEQRALADFSDVPMNWELLDALQLDLGALTAQWGAEGAWGAMKKQAERPGRLLAALLCAVAATAAVAAVAIL